MSSLPIIFKMGDFIGYLGLTNLNTFTSVQFSKKHDNNLTDAIYSQYFFLEMTRGKEKAKVDTCPRTRKLP